MLDPNVYNIIATNLIKSILEKGGKLECDTCAAARLDNDTQNKFVVCKIDKNAVDNTYNYTDVYDGDNVEDATKAYIDIVGAFVSMGQATKYYREHRQ